MAPIRYTRTEAVKPNGFWLVSSDCQRAGYFLACRKEDRQTPILFVSLRLSRRILRIQKMNSEFSTGSRQKNELRGESGRKCKTNRMLRSLAKKNKPVQKAILPRAQAQGIYMDTLRRPRTTN